MDEPGSGSSELRSAPREHEDYEVTGELGRGGMGVVLEARDAELGRAVALKVLDASLCEREDIRQRFVEEAQIGGQLQHPGLVPVYELGRLDDGRPFFAMKLVKGRTLAELFTERSSPTADARRFLVIFEAVCQTVAYAHSRGVVHRDLKPANVMVGAFGEVQVVDWGLAKVLGASERTERDPSGRSTVIETVRSSETDSTTASLAGSVLGTPAYMPPEQARGDVATLDARADVFALGAILCELLIGDPPYAAHDGESVLSQASRAHLAPANERLERCGADPALVELCQRCLAPVAGARPNDAAAVSECVQRHLAETEERARRAELAAAEARVRVAGERKARRLTTALAGLVVVTVLGVAGALTWLRSEREGRLERAGEDLRRVESRVLELQTAGRFDEALELARAGVAPLERELGTPRLRARSERLMERASELVQMEAERRELHARGRALLDALDELRIRAELAEATSEGATVDASFAQAFLAYGIDVEEDYEGALEALRDSGIAEEAALGLDEWAHWRREAFGWESSAAEPLTWLAVDLDPDPARMALREALLERDAGALSGMVTGDGWRALPPATLGVLGHALLELELWDELGTILRHAHAHHPDDFRLRCMLGFQAFETGRADFAAEQFEAARTLRPRNLELLLNLATTRFRFGQFQRARETGRLALKLEPEAVSAWDIVGLSAMFLGDYDEAVVAKERELALNPKSAGALVELAAARFRRGDLDARALRETLLASEPVRPYAVMVYAVALVSHPDPARRDAAAALEALDTLSSNERSQLVPLVARAAAHDLLGDDPSVLALCDEIEALAPVSARNVASRCANLRARAFHRIGARSAARSWLLEARRRVQSMTGADPTAWRRAESVRELRETEALLAE